MTRAILCGIGGGDALISKRIRKRDDPKYVLLMLSTK